MHSASSSATGARRPQPLLRLLLLLALASCFCCGSSNLVADPSFIAMASGDHRVLDRSRSAGSYSYVNLVGADGQSEFPGRLTSALELLPQGGLSAAAIVTRRPPTHAELGWYRVQFYIRLEANYNGDLGAVVVTVLDRDGGDVLDHPIELRSWKGEYLHYDQWVPCNVSPQRVVRDGGRERAGRGEMGEGRGEMEGERQIAGEMSEMRREEERGGEERSRKEGGSRERERLGGRDESRSRRKRRTRRTRRTSRGSRGRRERRGPFAVLPKAVPSRPDSAAAITGRKHVRGPDLRDPRPRLHGRVSAGDWGDGHARAVHREGPGREPALVRALLNLPPTDPPTSIYAHLPLRLPWYFNRSALTPAGFGWGAAGRLNRPAGRTSWPGPARGLWLTAGRRWPLSVDFRRRLLVRLLKRAVLPFDSPLTIAWPARWSQRLVQQHSGCS